MLSLGVLFLDQTGTSQAHGLSTAGWIFISIAWFTIISVAVFCYGKVIRLAEARKKVETNKAAEWAGSAHEEA